MDTFAESFFNFDKYYHSIFISKHSDGVCLLSDRGHVDLSSIFSEEVGIAYGFNLRKDGFIFINFLPNDITFLAKTLLKNAPDAIGIAKLLESRGVKNIQNSINVYKYNNETELLKSYNRHVIYQCFQKVFAACQDIEK